MQQTGYKGITALSDGLIYDAGWCEFYYTPIENIAAWPYILSTSQEGNNEPQLLPGKTWFGPIRVANQQLGFREEQQESPAGHFYRTRVEGFHPGDGRQSRVNLENMPYHKYVIVGKQRAGGLFILLGSEDCGLSFSHNFSTGLDQVASGSKFLFSANMQNKAVILPSFGGQPSSPSPGAVDPPAGEPGDASNQTELITFNNQNSLVIPWTADRKQLFGIMPTIEVWFDDGDRQSLANIPIICDFAPPDTTVFTIDLTGITNGFVVIK